MAMLNEWCEIIWTEKSYMNLTFYVPHDIIMGLIYTVRRGLKSPITLTVVQLHYYVVKSQIDEGNFFCLGWDLNLVQAGC